MEIIVPAAGLSSRFPNMKPKYLLTTLTTEQADYIGVDVTGPYKPELYRY